MLRQFDETDENAWAQIAAGAYEHDPAWLDAAKLKSLGFDIAPLMSVGMEDQGHLDRSELSLEVFLVLELNGPAYQRALAQTRRIAASERPSIDSAKHYLMEEEQNNSRLFVVDAGLDAGALRVKYPDRSHYAIVRGRVRPQWSILAKKSHLSGNIDRMSIDTINVPLGFRPIFMSKSGKVYNSDDENNSHPFEAVVAFGKRFEPWIIDASGK